jgi:hypothetical protein
MKTVLLSTVVCAVSIIVWQQSRIHALHRMEESLTRGTAAAQTHEGGKSREPETAPSPVSMAAGLPEEEFAKLTTDLQTHRQDFEPKRFAKLANVSGGSWIAVPHLCEPISRLNSRQLRSVLESWNHRAPTAAAMNEGRSNFEMMLRQVNPAALTQLYFELKLENKDWLKISPEFAMEHWFQQDPHGLGQWARSTGSIVTEDKNCALWVDAAEVLRSPSLENIRSFLVYQDWKVAGAVGHLVMHLPSDEARIQFFQSLHTATGGDVKQLGSYIYKIAQASSFSQLARLGDSVPPFVTPPYQKPPPHSPEAASGNLRYEIAHHSRDATATERWQWLLQRPADRPTGGHLSFLVKEWCDDDYSDTARWVKSLPPGSERETASKAVIEFLKWNKAYDLAAKWETEK